MGSFSLIEIIAIIFIHFISDFVMQDEKWALGKSKDVGSLINHTMTYSAIVGLTMCFILPPYKTSSGLYLSTIFFLVTVVFHIATDYITSRIISRRFEKETPFNIKLNYNIFKTGDILESSSTQLNKTGQTYSSNNFNIILMSKSGYLGGIEQYRAKRYNSIPNFGAFTLIGFDQVLHYIQLFGTYYILINI